MCSAIAVSVLSSMLSYREASVQAQSQRRYAEYNQEIARQDALAQYEATQRREKQENEAAAQQLEETRRASAQAQGTARVGAGRTAGQDVVLLLDDFAAQESRYRTAVMRNAEFRRDEFAAQREGIRLGLQQRIADNQPVAPPSFFGAALRIAGAYYENKDK